MSCTCTPQRSGGALEMQQLDAMALQQLSAAGVLCTNTRWMAWQLDGETKPEKLDPIHMPTKATLTVAWTPQPVRACAVEWPTSAAFFLKRHPPAPSRSRRSHSASTAPVRKTLLLMQ